MRQIIKLGLTGLLAACFVAGGATVAFSCSIPVFRYALERWQPEDYLLVVFNRGPLGPEEKVILDSLEIKIGKAKEVGTCNITVHTSDLNKKEEDALRELWESEKAPQLPWAVLVYPRMNLGRGGGIAWRGVITPELPDLLLDSPARQKIAGNIIRGDCAVWVLLESGDKAKDDRAAKELEDELRRSEKEIKLPELDEGDPDWPEEASPVKELAEELKVAFSVVRVSRTDPREKLFVGMLTHSEGDLNKEEFAGEPMAFPVFGQGRLSHALVGKGISAENVRAACEFIVGPCSCIVKEENDGTDLLMEAAWSKAVKDAMIQTIELPPLMGLPEPAQLVPEEPAKPKP